MFRTGHADHAAHGTKREQADCDARQFNYLIGMHAAPLTKALLRQSAAIEAQGAFAIANPKVAIKDFPRDLVLEYRAAVRGGTGAKLKWTCDCGSVNPKLRVGGKVFLLTTCCSKTPVVSAW